MHQEKVEHSSDSVMNQTFMAAEISCEHEGYELLERDVVNPNFAGNSLLSVSQLTAGIAPRKESCVYSALDFSNRPTVLPFHRYHSIMPELTRNICCCLTIVVPGIPGSDFVYCHDAREGQRRCRACDSRFYRKQPFMSERTTNG